MEMCKCTQEKEIQQMKIDIAVAQSDIGKVQNDIQAILKTLDKFNWWLIGIMGSSIVTLLTLLAKG